ncbi:MAG: methionine--tRNA ligase [Patescibacteria group bacterium]|nr:methionine--tRNA ligase [Patescibacteria group bacterium]
MITYEDFKKLDIRVGTIKEIEPIPETDKLLICQVDFGEGELRQIISGIKEFYPNYDELIDKQVLYIVNLESRKIKGFESNGMLMAILGEDGKPIFLIPEEKVKVGSKVT